MDCEHEGGCLGIGARRTEEVGVIGRKNQADHEERDDIETRDAPKHLLGGSRKRLSRVSGLSSSKADKLGPAKSERGVDEDGAEPFEAIFERARIVPVVSAQVAAVDTGVDTSNVNNDGENDETDDGCDFDTAKNELDYRPRAVSYQRTADLGGRRRLTFTVASHTEELDDAEEEEENGDPNANVELLPKRDSDTSSGDFEGQNGQPAYRIIPAHGEAPANVCYSPIFQAFIVFVFVPSFVDEPATVGEEGTVDGVEDGKLSQSLHGK